MGENKYKENHMRTSVENHAAAAWADSEMTKDISGVNLPDETQVMNAKEYADENHK